MNSPLQFGAIDDGCQRCCIDLDSLYADGHQRDRFERRWEAFLTSCGEYGRVFRRDGAALVYSTETFVPSLKDRRKPVLLLFGNPAPQSVLSGICFAFEGSAEREHRLWKVLRTSSLLEFPGDVIDQSLPSEERNRAMREALFSLRYSGPFRYAVAVMYSMPSPASDPVWSGVSGLVRLFGRAAFGILERSEIARVTEIVDLHLGGSGGAILAFQAGAYEALRGGNSPRYAASQARRGGLVGASACGHLLVGLPPTRLAHSSGYAQLLKEAARMVSVQPS